MKYIIFVPILLIYLVILSLISFVQCLWLFDFKNFNSRMRNLNYKIKIGYWLANVTDINKW